METNIFNEWSDESLIRTRMKTYWKEDEILNIMEA